MNKDIWFGDWSNKEIDALHWQDEVVGTMNTAWTVPPWRRSVGSNGVHYSYLMGALDYTHVVYSTKFDVTDFRMSLPEPIRGEVFGLLNRMEEISAETSEMLTLAEKLHVEAIEAYAQAKRSRAEAIETNVRTLERLKVLEKEDAE